MSRPSLILLRSDEPHHEALERLLATRFDLRAVVVEPGGAQRRRLFQRGRKQAYRWRIYHMWRRRLMGSARFRRKFFAKVGGRPDVNYGSTVVDSINDPAVHQILRNTPHSFVIVIGTSILSPTSLAASPRRFINIHGGCLPHYKGNHCVFKAYLDEEVYLRHLDRVLEIDAVSSVAHASRSPLAPMSGGGRISRLQALWYPIGNRCPQGRRSCMFRNVSKFTLGLQPARAVASVAQVSWHADEYEALGCFLLCL